MDNNASLGAVLNDTNKLISTVLNLQQRAKKYNSQFTILFHNSIFPQKNLNYKEAYATITSRANG